jgi:hypothetical protein
MTAAGYFYAIRLPANAVLREKIAHRLFRPVGRPSLTRGSISDPPRRPTLDGEIPMDMVHQTLNGNPVSGGEHCWPQQIKLRQTPDGSGHSNRSDKPHKLI